MSVIKKYLKEFSKNLGPRYRIMNGMNTEFSGQEYREDHLKKMLEDNENNYILNIDDTQGTSSFWEEAFGGAVRDGYSIEYINKKIHIESIDTELLSDIQKFMQRASEKNGIVK